MEISKLKQQISFELLLNQLPTQQKAIKTQDFIFLLGEQIRKFTGGDSSLSKESTQMLSDAINYTITFYLKQYTSQEALDLMIENTLDNLYKISYQYLIKMFNQCLEQIENIQLKILSIDLDVYLETLCAGLLKFHEAYNFDYSPHIVGLTLDYPTCRPLTQDGLERMYEYLYYINIEHELLNFFNENLIQEMLFHYHSDYRLLIFNVSELLFKQLLLKYLVGGSLDYLVLSQGEVKEIEALLKNKCKFEIEKLLFLAFEKLQLDIPLSKQALNYFYDIILGLSSVFYTYMGNNVFSIELSVY